MTNGKYYYNARWYDPNLGRFITEDPIRAGNNWFIYVNNSPLVFVDPTGLEDAPFNTQTGPIPTIKEVETGDNWYNNVFDTFAAGAAGILNWGASLGNMAIGGLAGIGEGIEKLDDAIPDKHSLTGMGQVEDLNAIAIYLGMNPAELAMAMQGLKNLPVALANMGKSTSGDINPAELARAWQGKGAYPGVDDWTNVTLPKGTKVSGGAPGQSSFYTSEATLQQAGTDASKIFEGLQAGKGAYPQYRPGMTTYELTQDTIVGASKALANPQFGTGGLPQYYIPQSKNLNPLYTILLENR